MDGVALSVAFNSLAEQTKQRSLHPREGLGFTKMIYTCVCVCVWRRTAPFSFTCHEPTEDPMRSSIRIPSPPRASTHCFRPLCTPLPACFFEHHITMGGRSTTTCVCRGGIPNPRVLLRSNNNKQARQGSPPRFGQVSYIMYERVCVRAGYRHAGGRGRIPVRRPAAGVRVTAYFFFLPSLTHDPLQMVISAVV
jgi:hypothetical protein